MGRGVLKSYEGKKKWNIGPSYVSELCFSYIDIGQEQKKRRELFAFMVIDSVTLYYDSLLSFQKPLKRLI